MEYEEAVGLDVHPDELEMDDEALAQEAEELMVNSERQHLAEILGEDGDTDCEGSDQEDVDVEPEAGEDAAAHRLLKLADFQDPAVASASFRSAHALLGRWSWELRWSERLLLAVDFLRAMASHLVHTRQTAEPYVTKARQDRAQVAAAAFKRARFIGATVTGAARRLEALRAAEPFAVVVEEACEVMEAPLMAVVAVKSVRKLELVGDHRQLPAFIQNCWFSLETQHPALKISLFERLLHQGKGRGQEVSHKHRNEPLSLDGASSCTVLDEQRRMRKTIGDITRPDYKDLVNILDHPNTASQRVGDKLLQTGKEPAPPPAFPNRHGAPPMPLQTQRAQLKLHRGLWSSQGRAVPGLQTCLFFWDLPGNKEGRPLAGLSACNLVEANAAAQLVAFFLLCGIPPAAISIITPYKGQTRAIINALQKCAGVGAAARQALTISTVDRYQGDENDVVILSLVKTSPGNRFVGLRNRFIVGVSRARLGFVVLGSLAAVTTTRGNGQGPAHWRRFAAALRSPQAAGMDKGSDATERGSSEQKDEEEDDEEDDEDEDDEDEKDDEKLSLDDSFGGPRIGAALPICCPRHQTDSRSMVNFQIQQKTKVAKSEFPTQQTWAQFCSLPCSYELPGCGHRCSVPCHNPVLITHTQSCQELVARPCIAHKDVPLRCCAVLKPPKPAATAFRGATGLDGKTGNDLAQALRTFQCCEKVEYVRHECLHKLDLPCHQHKRVMAREETLPECICEVEDFAHPVCNHIFKKPTCITRRGWEINPPSCNVKVKHKAPCGCVSHMACWRHLEEMASPSPCKNAVSAVRPRCQHKLSLRCHLSTELTQLWNKQDGLAASEEKNRVTVMHGFTYGPSESNLMPNLKLAECKVEVAYRAQCQHIRAAPCFQAFAWALGFERVPACTEIIRNHFRSPLCLHAISSVSCHMATALADWQPWGTAGPPLQDGKTPNSTLVVPEARLDPLATEFLTSRVRADVSSVVRLCNRQVQVERLCGSGHVVDIPCATLSKIALGMGKQPLPLCLTKVPIVLPCSHQILVACHAQKDVLPACGVVVSDSFLYSCGKHETIPRFCAELTRLQRENPSCPVLVDVERYRCRHQARVSCHISAALEASLAGQRLSKREKKEGKESRAIVDSSSVYCDEEPGLPLCEEFVDYRQRCGHVRSEVRCAQAFKWSSHPEEEPLCVQRVSFSSPLCGHDVTVECRVASNLKDWQPWEQEPSEFVAGPGKTRLRVVHQALMPKQAFSVLKDRGINPELLKCTQESVVLRTCGHQINLPCWEIYGQRLGDCREKVTSVLECEHENTRECHKAQKVPSPVCRVIVTKSCTVCKLETTEALCYKAEVVCKKEVTKPLSCGHNITWKCGEDEDPTEAPPSCAECLLPMWKAAASRPRVEPGVQAQWLDDLMQQIFSKLSQEDLKARQILPVLDSKRGGALEDARARIISKYREVVMCRVDEGDDGVIPEPPGALGSVGETKEWYDVVFVSVPTTKPDFEKISLKKEPRKWIQNCLVPGGQGAPPTSGMALEKQKEVALETALHLFRPLPTDYGNGICAQMFSLQNLSSCAVSDAGTVVVCVAAAFRHQVLTRTPPFKKGKGKADVANRKSSQQQISGYDCVDVYTGERGKEEKKILDNERRVYWYPGAVLPLAFLTLELHVQCCICQEYHQVHKGLKCDSKHFLCCEDCFDPYVDAANAPDALTRFLDRDGNLRCPVPDCEAVYSLQHAPETQFNKLLKLRLKAHERSVLPAAVEAERKRMEAEFARIQSIQNRDERDAEMLRMDVVENVLCLKCPRCDAAFLDFSGCFALTCSRPNCKAGFCAWCLKDCGEDAHAHVPQCPENATGGVFATEAEFKAHQSRRRVGLVKQRLRKATPAVRVHALRLLKRELHDLGIDPTSVGGPEPEIPRPAPAPGARDGDDAGNRRENLFAGFFGW
eukprot:gb/GEZN01000075.1/.p1 GENE.gb/GEZN01000075.1/~~gb/GEZN01000075.1/.p1  ORF type:complete len:1932 (-),score=209.52 gb/GEZN01000075.1/:490-6285(-)